MEKTSVLSNGLIWFGAAVSIAEIMTGALIAPLGFERGILAIVLGHVIGCVLLYGAGLIGAKTEKSAMETVKRSFGEKGSLIFSSLNVLQLVGWTAIMIISGAAAAQTTFPLSGQWAWSLIIGGLIVLWILLGFKNLGKVNVLAMGGLFVLTIVMSTVVFRGDASAPVSDAISFGVAVELSAAMPLSWLPLISDYTSSAKKGSTLASSLSYFAVSCWMYIIGLGAALFTGESDVANIMMSAGFGMIGLLIVVLSTVTTTFLDAYSAGISATSISGKVNGKVAGVVVTVIGTVLAIFAPMSQFEGFLYLIGSVFAPMIAILITDFFVLKKDSSGSSVNTRNIVIWCAGFALYRISMTLDTPIGNTLPIMVIVSMITVATDIALGGEKECLKDALKM